MEAFRSTVPAAIVLDLRLPVMSGIDVCREIKPQSPTVPIIVLSATAEIADKVLLLELGADDYVSKPFSPRELLARVQAAIRHASRPVVRDVTAFDGISVNFAGMEVTREDHPVELTAQEFKTLTFFIKNAERVISREELLREAFGYQAYSTTHTVDNHIFNLRQKLERDPAHPPTSAEYAAQAIDSSASFERGDSRLCAATLTLRVHLLGTQDAISQNWQP